MAAAKEKTQSTEDAGERIATALESIVPLLAGIQHELFQLRKSRTGPAATGKSKP